MAVGWVERRTPLKRGLEVEEPSLMKGELPLDREQVSLGCFSGFQGQERASRASTLRSLGARIWISSVSGDYGDLDKVHLAVTFMENHLGVTAECEY